MKRGICLFWAAALLAVSTRADEGKLRFFVAPEYWLAGDAYDDTADLMAQGWMGTTGGVTDDISGAAGMRAGAFYRTPVEGLDVGGSLGYVAGPTAKFHTYMATPFSTWDIHDDYENNFIRILPQVRQRLQVSESFDVRLNLGVGLALGSVKSDHTCVDTGAALCGSAKDSASKKFSGLTYEVGPSLSYTGRRVDIELAVTYAGYPTQKAELVNGVSYIPEFKWTPLGVRLGVEF